MVTTKPPLSGTGMSAHTASAWARLQVVSAEHVSLPNGLQGDRHGIVCAMR